MVKTLKRMLIATGFVAGGLVLLAGCGRKADLDPPSMPAEQQNQQSAPTPTTVPDQPFALDPLL